MQIIQRSIKKNSIKALHMNNDRVDGVYNLTVGMGGLTGAGIGVVAGAGGTVGWLLSTICNQTGTR